MGAHFHTHLLGFDCTSSGIGTLTTNYCIIDHVFTHTYTNALLTHARSVLTAPPLVLACSPPTAINRRSMWVTPCPAKPSSSRARQRRRRRWQTGCYLAEQRSVCTCVRGFERPAFALVGVSKITSCYVCSMLHTMCLFCSVAASRSMCHFLFCSFAAPRSMCHFRFCSFAAPQSMCLFLFCSFAAP